MATNNQTSLTTLGTPVLAQAGNQISGTSDVHLQDSFWEYADIKKERWNQVHPYRLALYQKTIDSQGVSHYAPEILPTQRLAPFTLPIPPENFSITTPFAITTTVTLGGIIEEHNGAPLRIITLSGTTGILPLRGSVNSVALNLQTTILAGTLNSVGTLIKDAQSLGGPRNNDNVVSKDELTAGADTGTGYYQFKLLERWFEAYVAFKKTANGRDFIMALEIWKDNAIYLVTPVSFTGRRSAASPLEYTYEMQFKAWKRIKPTSDGPNTFNHLPVARDPNVLFKVLNTLSTARQVLQDAKNVLKTVRADINQVLFTPIRESILFCKDLVGVALTAVDLPSNIITDLKESLLEAVALGRTTDSQNSLVNKTDATPVEIEKKFQALAVQVSKAEIIGGQLTTATQKGLNNASPANKVADNPDDNFSFFSNIKPGSLNLRPATKKKIDDEKKRVRLLKREDFEKARNSVTSVLIDFESAVGAGNETYAKIYGTPIRPGTRTPTESDYDVIFALNRVVMEMNRLAASSTINQDEVSSIDFFAGLATRSGIAFTTPKSKFLVPLPYSHTLEQVSLIYLGTPDRWHEIAALNGLQAPYIDETGFSVTLLTNGNGNTVTVGDATNLFIQQPIWIGSLTVSRTKRRITRIDRLSPTMNVVYVDGDANLSQYTLASNSTLQAFLPNTVNSQMSIFIPSDVEADDTDFRQKSIPGIDYFDPLVQAGGIDLLLTNKGDLVITPDGDTRLAVGLTNIVQKVRLVLDTPKGSLLHHPDYGFPLQPGDSTADLSAQDILDLSKDLFKGDPTFTGVESAAILKDGGVVKMALSVGIAGTGKTIPITVEIPR